MIFTGMRSNWFQNRRVMVLIWVILLPWTASCTTPEVITSSPSPPVTKSKPAPSKPLPEKPALSKPAQASRQTRPGLGTIPFTIQVGAFSTTERAARFSLALQQQGVDAYYFIDVDGLYKVRIERFKDARMARQRALYLKEQGLIEEYVVQPVSKKRKINPKKSLRTNIVQTAHRFIGTPYRWGGTSASRGFDCSGLTMTVYRLNGLALPRNSRSQFKKGERIKRRDLKKGDLVFFATDGRRRVSHVGIYTGKDQFVHAPGRGKHIRVSSMDKGYYKRRFMGARRYF